MAQNSLTSGKFAEELYFLLMASPLRNRIQTLGAKYGLTAAALRSEVIAFGDTMGHRADFSMQETVYSPRQTAG
ncbi:MAG: hypothetical protein IH624_08150 [Phycisphaerae bacterium]|nr:hypothetical protein [Phycisphaerae bacterium]